MGMVDAVSGYAYVGNNPVNLIDPMGLAAQLNLFAPGTAEYKFAQAYTPPPNTFVIAGHSNPNVIDDQRNGANTHSLLNAGALAPMVYNHSDYKPNMNAIVLGCNSACPRSDGKPNLAQGLYTELQAMGGQGSVAGTNSFVWLNSSGTARVAPDLNGKTWSDIRTEADVKALRPDFANGGGFTIYGDPTRGIFQQPFSKQVEKTFNGGSTSLGDWLPFAGGNDQTLGGFMSGSTNAPYSGNALWGLNPRSSK
jgi:hypothetical protein